MLPNLCSPTIVNNFDCSCCSPRAAALSQGSEACITISTIISYQSWSPTSGLSSNCILMARDTESIHCIRQANSPLSQPSTLPKCLLTPQRGIRTVLFCPVVRIQWQTTSTHTVRMIQWRSHLLHGSGTFSSSYARMLAFPCGP